MEMSIIIINFATPPYIFLNWQVGNFHQSLETAGLSNIYHVLTTRHLQSWQSHHSVWRRFFLFKTIYSLLHQGHTCSEHQELKPKISIQDLKFWVCKVLKCASYKIKMRKAYCLWTCWFVRIQKLVQPGHATAISHTRFATYFWFFIMVVSSDIVQTSRALESL